MNHYPNHYNNFYPVGFLTGRDIATFGTKGQMFLHCPGTKGQTQNLVTGWDSLSNSRTERGMGQDNHYFFPYDFLS